MILFISGTVFFHFLQTRCPILLQSDSFHLLYINTHFLS